ncbi:urease accessory protein UreE [Mesorhizobium sp. M8A.F.Ca.ET.173.01.1.1]|nr:urease accessory protein UreE [Mesorhizobium sp. M8A.F.Ca.ET.173.01.1.1]
MTGDRAASGELYLALNSIVGNAHRELHGTIHELGHHGRVEWISIAHGDIARRRIRTFTDRGRGCTIELPRDARLEDGAVLHLAADLAVVIRVDSGEQLVLVPHDLKSALRLGHWCGNLHWKVEFGEDRMTILLDGPSTSYRARLHDLQTLASFHIEGSDG